MTICIRKTTWPVACMALAIVILFTASAAMGAGGGAADGHVGGPGISDYTAGTGSQGGAAGAVGSHAGPRPDVVRGGGRRSRTVPPRR